ncbi:MAG: hypothetical protein FWG91_02840 [Lachnospiraceae bacterium]|nr:hypothetical protein [Lachnospiraceae bacterium]
MKKIILLSIFFIVIAINGCGKNENKDPYLATIIAEDININRVSNFVEHKNQIKILGDYYVLDNDDEVKVLTFNTDGTLISETLLNLPEESESAVITSYAGIGSFDSDGGTWLVYNKNDDGERSHMLVSFDENGNYVKTVDISLIDFENSFYYSLTIDNNANGAFFYFHLDNYILTYTEDGFLLESKNELKDHQIKGILKLYDERIIAVSQKQSAGMNSPTYITCFCPSECEQIILEDVKANFFSSFFRSGNADYEILLLSPTSVMGYKLNGERSELANWSLSGVHNSDNNMYQHTILADDAIYCLEENIAIDEIDFTRTINLLKLQESGADLAKRKKVINVATVYEDAKIKNAVINFNRNSDDYFISFKTYSTESSSGWATDEAITAFNIDIIAGNIPDLVFLSRNMPIKTYATRGYFADLYEFIDTDPHINRNDYLANVLGLLETDGKLLLGTSSFGIRTIIGKAIKYDTLKNFAWDDLTVLMDGQADDVLPIGHPRRAMSKAGYLGYSLNFLLNDYIDYELGISSFESLEFINLLKTTDFFPMQANDYNGIIDYMAGNPLMMESFFNNFGNIEFEQAYLEADFGTEDVIYLSSSCVPFDLFAIFANAKEKDGAWEFARYFLGNFQETAKIFSPSLLLGIPIKISAIEDLAERARNRPDYDQVGVNGNLITVRRPSDEYIQRILDLIYSLNHLDLVDDKIREIILDDANYYFAGQKSAEEVAAIIDNRVSLYLADIN